MYSLLGSIDSTATQLISHSNLFVASRGMQLRASWQVSIIITCVLMMHAEYKRYSTTQFIADKKNQLLGFSYPH